MARDADQSVTGAAGPSDHEEAGQFGAGLRIDDLVLSTLIAVDRLGGVALGAHGETELLVVDVADGEDHGVHVERGRLIGGLGGGSLALLHQVVFGNDEAVDAAVGTF